MADLHRPGGALMTRPLHFFWVVDCSGSMDGEKIATLNYAIRTAIPAMQDAASGNPNAHVLVRAVKFDDNAQWHVGSPTPVEAFTWIDLRSGGLTSMGKALKLVAEQLRMPPMEQRALPPVIVLLSDGQPTDDFAAGLAAVENEPWGKKAVRIAIAIGNDADEDVLQRFIGHSERRPLKANNADDLVKFIRWASTAVVKEASSPTRPGPPPLPGSASAPPPVSPIIQDAPDSSGPVVW
jgi:Uncharacterized protein encoded in toxicity protection region of plasmid R478, contains von Willebrand factor (vWF) domain